jgi:uncharacterized protein (DUF983 family)
MRRACSACALPYFRESGYYMGAMILNYGVTAAIILLLYLLSLVVPDVLQLSSNLRMTLWMTFAIALSLLLMRFSYSMWLSYDYWLEPWTSRFASSSPEVREDEK